MTETAEATTFALPTSAEYKEAGRALWNEALNGVEDVAEKLKAIMDADRRGIGEIERATNFHVGPSDIGELVQYVYDAKCIADVIGGHIAIAEAAIATLTMLAEEQGVRARTS